MVAENIFKDFTQGNFAGYKRGVARDLDQYLVDQFAFHHWNEHRGKHHRPEIHYSLFKLWHGSITVPAEPHRASVRLQARCGRSWTIGPTVAMGFKWPRGSRKLCFTDVLPQIRVYEGNLAAQGGFEQRRDIRTPCSMDGRKQGQKIQSLITQQSGKQRGKCAMASMHRRAAPVPVTCALRLSESRQAAQ